MTAFAARIARIEAEAKRMGFWHTVLSLIASFFFVIGWIIGKIFVGIWAIITWTISAIKIGFRDATRKGA